MHRSSLFPYMSFWSLNWPCKDSSILWDVHLWVSESPSSCSSSLAQDLGCAGHLQVLRVLPFMWGARARDTEQPTDFCNQQPQARAPWAKGQKPRQPASPCFLFKSPLSQNPMPSRSEWECPAFQPMWAIVGHVWLCPTSSQARGKSPPTTPPCWEGTCCQVVTVLHAGLFTVDSCLCYAMCLNNLPSAPSLLLAWEKAGCFQSAAFSALPATTPTFSWQKGEKPLVPIWVLPWILGLPCFLGSQIQPTPLYAHFHPEIAPLYGSSAK